MTKIKFGTDGWRAIIAKDYTNANVARVATATALWVKKHHESPSIVIGYDCRFGGWMFTELATKIFCEHGVKVYMAKEFVSTPMVSLGVVTRKASAGVVITASHNPPSYNGYKIKADFGGPATPASIAEVESLLPDSADIPETSLSDYEAKGLLEYVDLETEYVERVESHFDMDRIRKSGLKVAFDAMYGAGQNAMRRLFPDAALLHCEYNPSFMGQAPEPIARNLKPFAEFIRGIGDIDFGLANDGDADRIGLLDGEGNFIDSHRILLLLVHYLYKYKGIKGKVVTTFSVTDKVNKLAAKYGLESQTTKIGFKYISQLMVQDDQDILVGGEESGGIAAKGHIPERDGIWIGLIILEAMAVTGKSLNELIDEVYAEVGAFCFDRYDLHLPEAQKLAVIDRCKSAPFENFGTYKVQRLETTDGFKFHFSDDEWVMIRPSGTEPVLRVYAEAPTLGGVADILETVKACILG